MRKLTPEERASMCAEAMKAREASRSGSWVRQPGCHCNHQTLESGCPLHDWTGDYEE